VLGQALIPAPLYTALLATVVLTIAGSTVLVRVRPISSERSRTPA
jgi:hypothetical protein